MTPLLVICAWEGRCFRRCLECLNFQPWSLLIRNYKECSVPLYNQCGIIFQIFFVLERCINSPLMTSLLVICAWEVRCFRRCLECLDFQPWSLLTRNYKECFVPLYNQCVISQLLGLFISERCINSPLMKSLLVICAWVVDVLDVV